MSAKKQVIEEFLQFLQKKAGDGIRSRKGGQEFPGSEEEVDEGSEVIEEEVPSMEMEESVEEVLPEEEAAMSAEGLEEDAPVEEGLTGQPDEATIQRMLSRVKRRR